MTERDEARCLRPNYAAGDKASTSFAPQSDKVELVRRHSRNDGSATKGEGVMKGQMLEPPVTIVKAARVK